MNAKLLLLAAAASLAAAACTRDKPAAEKAATAPAADTAVVISNRDTALYFANARHLAQRVGQDLGLTDVVVVERLVPVFVERERSLADLDARPDTAGAAVARRAANEKATRGVNGVLTDPAQQRAYAERQSTYYNGSGSTETAATPAADTAAAVKEAPHPAAAPAHRRGPAVVKYEKERDGDVKIKYANGAKVKISADGDRKVVTPSGRKVKVVGETGERKVKD